MFFSFSAESFTEKEQRQLLVRRIFRRVFLEDWGTKLIALGITAALWLGVTGLRAPTTVRLKNITLITRISNDMEITNTPSDDVEIVVTGDKRIIDRLNARDLVVSVDLTDVKSGDRIVQLTPETVSLDLPSGLKLDEIQPNKISVKIEIVKEKEIDVRVETEGSLAEGFEIYNVNVIPAKVRARGAESFIKSLDSVSTERIDITGLKDSFYARQIGLNLGNPKITLLDTIVDVNFKIGEKRVERLFNIPVNADGKDRNVTFVLWGGRSSVEKIRVEDLLVEIVKDENGAVSPNITLPADLQDKIEIIKKKITP